METYNHGFGGLEPGFLITKYPIAPSSSESSLVLYHRSCLSSLCEPGPKCESQVLRGMQKDQAHECTRLFIFMQFLASAAAINDEQLYGGLGSSAHVKISSSAHLPYEGQPRTENSFHPRTWLPRFFTALWTFSTDGSHRFRIYAFVFGSHHCRT